jgi:hypothetical protein
VVATKAIEDILTALKAIQGKPLTALTQGDDFKLPRLIPADTVGASIQITKEIDDLIGSLARTLKASRSSLVRTIKDDEWRSWVRATIGPLLAKTPLSTPATTAAPLLLTQLDDALNDIVAGLSDREYAFGTTLFSNTDVSSFTIGPVRFEPREVWLERKMTEGDVTLITKRRVKRRWSGGRASRRKSNREQMREDDIVEAIGRCPYVCTVKLRSSFAPAAGLETALTAARLALACVSLAFATPSLALLGFNLHYDGPIHLQKALLFVPGKIVLAGSRPSRHLHGPFVLAQDWQTELTRLHHAFLGAGEVLVNLTDPARSIPQAPLLEALLQSLLWFEKGCREIGDLMAIVSFAASLDALGKGTKVRGILEVLKARLGVQPTDPINPLGPTFKSVLDTIYSEGRSRTVHGTSDKIGYDWGDTRIIAEQLARYALIACLDYTSQNPSAMQPDDLKR